ncbi:amino acid transporter, putative [Talaromyces stipitatus ATCC 10500]|uniref:Amino acid transporter, putative n=1 Tax=Talaromyces stipitatus (strain ATCC 10500 / CBS 375.48 / QM 6759 / NRRL 1006) TaxID=441959 RepID=B8MDX1_TALSN|nr:amino acid transporter, putative [Talaromyces stipitatus ATCC 10500]EED16048.1 amino acid transporter, putative [Talaromyces stipitatus ATCC 10500]
MSTNQSSHPKDCEKFAIDTSNALESQMTNGTSGTLESAELRPRFSVLAAVGMQYSISATPLAVGGYLTFILGVGGSPYFFYCFLVAAFGQMLVCISLAEIAAVYPHASGQVFWTAALSPPEWARFLSYWNGASTTLGWVFANAGTYVFAAQIFLGAIMVRFPDYVAKSYQVFLIAVACGVIGILLNTLLFKIYPAVSKFMVWFINAGTIFIFVALLTRTTPKASARQVFIDVVNETGWSSNGLVFLLGFLPGSVAIACFDTAAHMAEEMDQPDRQVPQVMIGASLLCALSAIPMIITFLFCTTNPYTLLNPIGGQPVYQVLHDAFHSDGLLVVALIIYCVVYISSCPAAIATASRLIWSFVKHGGMPGARWIGEVHPVMQVPLNAILLTVFASCLISLLVFGPSTVLNGVFGAGGICFAFSYGMPIWLLLLRGRSQLPKKRYCNLGKIGVPLNILAVCWQLISVTFLSFPLYRPVTLGNMNWASACGAVGLGIFVVNWFVYSRRNFRPPRQLYVRNLQQTETDA